MFREDGADGDIEVKYRTIDKTAYDGKDFTGGEGTIYFKSGETTKDIKIPIIDDMSASGTEEFFEVELFALSNEGCKFGAIPRTTVTIANDEEYQQEREIYPVLRSLYMSSRPMRAQ